MTFNLKLSLNLLAAGFSLTYLAASAQAACVSGDCAAMGYNKTESACSGDIIRCPFDTSKVFCKEKEVYVMEAGDILYSDKTTAHYHTDDSKTPIGIVVDPERRLAMALSCSAKQWAADRTFANNNIAAIPDKEPEDAKTDFNGKSYTTTIVNICGTGCPAAYYAHNYSTTGTAKGDWFLPSGGQLKLLDQNKTDIKVGFAKVNGTFPSSGKYLLTSNEGPDKYNDFKLAIHMSLSTGESYFSTRNKYSSAYLDSDFSCPFIEF